VSAGASERAGALRRLDALHRVGLSLARQAPSGRILLARVRASIEIDWIPLPWGEDLIDALQEAYERAREPLPLATIERALSDAWGSKPTDELDELEPEPVAVTPSAQVHRAALDGEPVAVKVLRPGLPAAVRNDLTLLESLLAPLSAAFPALDAGAILEEFRERVLDELDLEHEATIQRHFHRRLRGHAFLTVPAPITRLCHEGVLVSEWVEGVPLWRAPDPDLAAARLVVFVLGAGRQGFVHADPHPDDVLVTPDGRLAILDFGATRPIAAERVGQYAAALDAFAMQDSQELGAVLQQLGWLPARNADTALTLGHDVLDELAGSEPVRLDSDALLAARDRLFDQPDAIAELIVAGKLPPEDLWPLRGAAQAFASIARVGATGPWRELARASLREGWAANPG
jgi:predicted unusual protein kinase regulating ubiquinone biosynthesis (AarF/ABC1/UbiB family)